MDKGSKKNYGCCLIELLLIIAIMYVGYSSRDWGKEYLVEKTNYIHSTNNEEKCRFIRLAKDRNYKISRISRSEAIDKEKKICKFCYFADEQKKYNKELRERKKRNISLKDWIAWTKLEFNKEADLNVLFVYMESSGKLHINGNCIDIKEITTRRNLNDVKAIETTCEDCVGREYCDFIYKKINDGIYNLDLIRSIEEGEEENDLEEESFEPGDYGIDYSDRARP